MGYTRHQADKEYKSCFTKRYFSYASLLFPYVSPYVTTIIPL